MKTFYAVLMDGRTIGTEAETREDARPFLLAFARLNHCSLEVLNGFDVEEGDPKEPVTAVRSAVEREIFWVTPDGADFLLDENGTPSEASVEEGR